MIARVHSRLYMSVSLGLIILTVLVIILSGQFIWKGDVPKQTTENAFVTRSGSWLLLGGKKFRFSGANIYWLGLQQTKDGISYPSHFQVDDALGTAAWMGATVVRSHSLGISVGCSLCIEPMLGQFNQVAFQHIDYAIESARKHHIKLIIPLTDNWHYYNGGKHTFTDWRGISDENQFYSNPQVTSDFKQYVSLILNHVNSYNGIAYKNDPTILAWETGNELSAPFNWVQLIANYIKSIDSHHLVMDGNYEWDHNSSNFLSDLSIKTLDLYTGHYYPPTISALSKQINQVTKAGKVFIVGEYDWNTNTGDALGNFLLVIEHSKAAGDMYWALFPHNDMYGYVQQIQHFTLHYPGDTSEMQRRVRLLLTHAYAMRGLLVPTKDLPGTPYITFVTGNAIAWRGAVGADTYSVERSTMGPDGPWTIICDRCATDNDTPWIDTSKPLGSVWYRVRGYTELDTPGPYSNIYWSAG